MYNIIFKWELFYVFFFFASVDTAASAEIVVVFTRKCNDFKLIGCVFVVIIVFNFLFVKFFLGLMMICFECKFSFEARATSAMGGAFVVASNVNRLL